MILVHMLFKIGSLPESTVAVFALVGHFSGVCEYMFFQIADILRSFRTHGAHMPHIGFPCNRVFNHIGCQLSL